MKNNPFVGSGIIRTPNGRTAAKSAERLAGMRTGDAHVDIHKDTEGESRLAACFLGPRAENQDLFMKLLKGAMDDHAYWRRNFHPEDPEVITNEIQRKPGYLHALSHTESELFKLLAQLKGSVPFSSMRYQGHMCWDQTIPGMVGYAAAMLYNQNNTATEASPVTTVLEYEVGQDLCRMFGYRTSRTKDTKKKGILAWGHLTCGGTTANVEALWAMRNARYYPVAIRKAVDSGNLTGVDALTVTLANGSEKSISELDSWELLNLTVDETLSLPARVIEMMMAADSKPSEDEAQALLERETNDYLLQNVGLLGLYTDGNLPPVDGKPIKPPVFFVPASKHYSLPKAAAILGVGQDNLRAIDLDSYGRMDTTLLRGELQKCLDALRPVVGVVAVLGTTEEGNVDPLAEVLGIREEMRKKGLDFGVHADAAWGGYFAAMLERGPAPGDEDGPLPVSPMSDYVRQQFEALAQADTITVDPHKTGYLPYPAGALCYRNKLMRSLVAFSAPYTNNSQGTGNDGQSTDDADNTCKRPEAGPDKYSEDDLTIGPYGVEGSKPGAAAAGVYLSHRVIPTGPSGYGSLLGRTMINAKLFHVALLGLGCRYENLFYAEPMPHTPKDQAKLLGNVVETLEDSESHPVIDKDDPCAIIEMLQTMRYNEIIDHPLLMGILKENGADLNIVCFAFNFEANDGQPNKSLAKANAFNREIFEQCDVDLNDNIYNYRFVTSSTAFSRKGYGGAFFDDYVGRLLKSEGDTSWDDDEVFVMRAVIMDPWLTENRDGKPFLLDVIAELGDIVCEVARESQKEATS